MTLFQHLCRESGEVFHLLFKPVSKPAAPPAPTTQTLHQQTTTTQQQVSETIVFRRTVIEEVEVRKVPIQD